MKNQAKHLHNSKEIEPKLAQEVLLEDCGVALTLCYCNVMKYESKNKNMQIRKGKRQRIQSFFLMHIITSPKIHTIGVIVRYTQHQWGSWAWNCVICKCMLSFHLPLPLLSAVFSRIFTETQKFLLKWQQIVLKLSLLLPWVYHCDRIKASAKYLISTISTLWIP